MASKRVVLPPVKLTKRPTHGKKKVEYLYRGMSESALQFENASFSAPRSSTQPKSECVSQEILVYVKMNLQLLRLRANLLLLGGKKWGWHCLMLLWTLQLCRYIKHAFYATWKLLLNASSAVPFATTAPLAFLKAILEWTFCMWLKDGRYVSNFGFQLSFTT